MNRNHPSPPLSPAPMPSRALGCMPCAWLRLSLRATVRVVTVLASTLLAVASTPSGPAWAANEAAASRTNPPLQLVYRTVTLPSAQVGQLYARLLAAGGNGPYRLDASGGALPPGLQLAPDGTLSGTPSAKGRYPFTLTVADQSQADGVLQQPYVLVVNPARGTAASAPASAAAGAVVSRDALTRKVDSSDTPRAVVWKLSAEEIQKALPEEPALTEVPAKAADASGSVPAPAASAASGAAADAMAPAKAKAPVALAAETPWPTAELVIQRLEPMLDIEYPTQAMFEAALAAQLRVRCRDIVARSTQRPLRMLPANTCRDDPKATAPAAAASGLTPEQTYQALLPAKLRAELIGLAAKPHPFTEGLPTLWSGKGCNCSPARPTEQVYGLHAFWNATQKVQAIDFSAYTRIGVLGKYLRDDGGLAGSPHWDDQSPTGIRVAQQHGTKLDLVLYRNEWPRLLALSDAQREQVLRRAAQEAVASMDTPLTGAYVKTKQVLLAGWPEPRHLYDGLTVFFDYEPSVVDARTQATDMVAYRAFFRAFILQLISEMERSGRDHVLNIVVPDHLMTLTGSAYSVEDLLDYLLRTRSLPSSRPADSKAVDSAARRGSIQMRLLVLLQEPTTDTKKALRERLDRTDALQSHVRAEFLESLLPIMVYPMGKAPKKPAPGEPAADAPDPPEAHPGSHLAGGEAFQFDADLAYYKWQFGGLALWPLTVDGVGASDDVRALVRRNYRTEGSWLREQFATRVCTIVCPNRSEVRLLWRLLLFIGVLAIGLYITVCKLRQAGPVKLKLGPLAWTVDNMGRRYLQGLILGGVLTSLVGGAMLSCDPDLVGLKESNGPLAFVLGSVLIWFLYRASQRRVPTP